MKAVSINRRNVIRHTDITGKWQGKDNIVIEKEIQDTYKSNQKRYLSGGENQYEILPKRYKKTAFFFFFFPK